MFEFLMWYFEVESQLGFKPDTPPGTRKACGKIAMRLWYANYSALEAARKIREAAKRRD